MKKTVLLFLCFLFLSLSSCDCLQLVQGYVIDYQTNLPIEGAIISKFKNEITTERDTGYVRPISDSSVIVYGNAEILTDSSGYFEFAMMAAGIFGCPKIKLTINKNGYKSVLKTYRCCVIENDTIAIELLDSMIK